MKVSVKKEGKSTNKLLKSLQALDGEFIEIGHFREQGDHSDSGFTYPEILSMWHFGAVEGHEGVIRSPLLNYSFEQIQSHKLTQSPEFKSAMNKWARNVLKASSDDVLLNDIGELTREQYRAVFGVIGRYMPSDSTGTPMLETGELKDAVAYRTSKNKSIKEG